MTVLHICTKYNNKEDANEKYKNELPMNEKYANESTRTESIQVVYKTIEKSIEWKAFKYIFNKTKWKVHQTK